MGKAAHDAALIAHLFQYRLLAASSPHLDRDRRARELEQVLTQWPAICRAMAKLSEIAPNTARKAQHRADQTQDFIANRSAEQ